MHTEVVGKPEGKRPLERSECRWENKIKIDFRRNRWAVWTIRLAEDRDQRRAFVNTVMKLRIP
jgi:hypothetical protein